MIFDFLTKRLKKPRAVGVKEILLIELPPWDPRTPPLGLAYLATFLKSKGINAKVFDLNIDMYNTEDTERKKGWGNDDYYWWRSERLEEKYAQMFEHFAEKILKFDSRFIGFSTTLPSIPFLNNLLVPLKRKSPDKVIIVGGPGTFFLETRRRDFVKRFINYFVIGDGELALYELLSGLDQEGNLLLPEKGSLRTWKEYAGEKTICVQTAKIADLDSMPHPTFEEFDLSAYTEGHFTLPILFSKGCTKKCTFCSDRVLSYPYRCRKAEKVVEEISWHIGRYGNINTFRINDLSFNANLRFLNELCDGIISRGINIKWYGQAQVRSGMDLELFLKMKKAGCRQMDLGIESFCDRVLSMMNKGYSSADAVQFLKSAKKAGIYTNVLLIVGYPGETDKDFKETLECIKQNSEYIDRIGSLNICGMPIGSELKNYPQKHNYMPVPGEWESCDGTNTYEVRKRRYNAVISCCRKLNIPVEGCLDLEVFESTKRR